MADFLMDIVYIAIVIAFFAVSSGLVRFCANLMDQGRRG